MSSEITTASIDFEAISTAASFDIAVVEPQQPLHRSPPRQLSPGYDFIEDDSTASMVYIAPDRGDDMLREPFITTPEPSISPPVWELRDYQAPLLYGYDFQYVPFVAPSSPPRQQPQPMECSDIYLPEMILMENGDLNIRLQPGQQIELVLEPYDRSERTLHFEEL